jgi:uncharacterized protein (UPF0212 family)
VDVGYVYHPDCGNDFPGVYMCQNIKLFEMYAVYYMLVLYTHTHTHIHTYRVKGGEEEGEKIEKKHEQK